MRGLVVVVALVLAGAVWAPSAGATGCRAGSGADLAGKTLTQQQIANVTLACANLRGAQLDGLDLTQADLTGADLAGATLANATLVQATLDNANLTRATLTSAKLGQARLMHANLTAARAEHADFVQATMTGAILTGLDARSADFTQATLTGATLTGLDGRSATFGQATLTGATLTGLKARSANFDQATLSGDNLTDVDLTGASLIQVKADRVRLDRVQLAGADLTQVDDAGASARHTSGLVPIDELAGIAAGLLAVLVLRRWCRRATYTPSGVVDRVVVEHALRRTIGGRLLARVVVAGALVGVVAAVVGAWSWLSAPPTVATAFVPVVVGFLFVIGAVFVWGSVRRARGPVVAVALVVVGGAGEYLFCAAGLAGALRPMEITAFIGTGGFARGWAGVGIGFALLVAGLIGARLSVVGGRMSA